ncbi:glutamate--tRNA ligase [Candidatus Parcubacteria bacterium]|nr:MAG: glutamate--tRNA ligase [Candidatus Parcubacteria bacterium]
MNASARQQPMILPNQAVRVRIAPSPTGFMHIGTARTALFNYLFAKKHGGKFILRIEDTDVSRSEKKYEKDIIDGLQWLGINWDEGVLINGDYGPYRQSERLEIYESYIKSLLEKNHAYYCFCAQEELEAIKQDQMSRGERPHYPGRCSNLTKEEIQKNLKIEKDFIIRIRMPLKKVSFNDLIRGKVEFDTELIGDVAIAKSLNQPLYNLAVVIDDELMKVSHVIRGEEHISNTTIQLILCEYMEFDPPTYAHIPLILAQDRSKLSKRHGAVSVTEYRKEGYLPEAVVNFMVLLGWNPGTEQEFFTLDELIKTFDLLKVQKAGAIFNPDKLKWFNSHYIKNKGVKELLNLCIPYFIQEKILEKTTGGFKNPKTKELVKESELEKIILLFKERMRVLSEITKLSEIFFIDLPNYDKNLLRWKELDFKTIKSNLLSIRKALEKEDSSYFNRDYLSSKLSEITKKQGVGETLWPLRVALSGLEASPGPYEIMDVIGKEKTIRRIDHAIDML